MSKKTTGNSKHRRGKSGKSPKLREQMKRQAEADERKAPKSTCDAGSVFELLKGD